MVVLTPLNGGLFKNVIEVQLVLWDKRFKVDYITRYGIPDYMELQDIRIIRKKSESLVN